MRWDYSTLWKRAAEIARALIACGMGKDSRVGILMTNRPEWISSFFGITLAGGVAIPLSTFSTAPELEYLLQISCISILLFERRVAKKDFTGMLCELEPQIRASGTGRPHRASFRSCDVSRWWTMSKEHPGSKTGSASSRTARRFRPRSLRQPPPP